MSENQLDLGAFLQQHTEEGTKESEGGFTVSHTNAAKKLARFALPRPYAWVSKFVQAAVAWKCERLRIAQGKELTVFYFETRHLSKLPTEQEIVNTMLSGKIGGTRPIDSFCTGLRSLVEQAKLSFLLVVDDGEVRPKPIYAGRHFGRLTEEQRLSDGFRPGPGIAITVAHIPSDVEKPLPIIGGNGHQLRISEELDQYCYLSPIPIRVDGLQIDGPLRSSLYNSTDRYRPLLVGGVKVESDGEPPLPLPQSFGEKHLSLLTHPQRALRSYGDSKNDYAAAFLVGWHIPRILGEYEYPHRRFSSVHWVRHGVIVESKKLPVQTFGLGCQIFLNADGLKSDLTGFQLVETADTAEREMRGVRGVGQRSSFNQIKLSLNAFRVDEDARSSEDEKLDFADASKKRIKILLKGSGAGLFLTLLNPPLGVPATLAGIVAAYLPRGNKTNQKLLTLRDKIEAMMEDDQKSLLKTLSTWTVLPPDSGDDVTSGSGAPS